MDDDAFHSGLTSGLLTYQSMTCYSKRYSKSSTRTDHLHHTKKIKKKSRRIRAYDNNNHTPLYRPWNSGLDEQSTIDSA